MKNWLRTKLRNFLTDGMEVEPSRITPRSEWEDFQSSKETLRFNVTAASGGIIVQYYIYDAKKDENINHIYVIHDDDATTSRIAEVVTLALLRR